MEKDELIVIEWSVSQGCFHSYTLKDMTKNNLTVCLKSGVTDYIPIGVFETERESYDFMEKYQPRLKREAQNVK